MYQKDFIVVAKSLNTNSFGLYQMVVVAKDGEAFKTCASYLNVKEEGEIVKQNFNIDPDTGNKIGAYFPGHELTESIKPMPKAMAEELFNKELI